MKVLHAEKEQSRRRVAALAVCFHFGRIRQDAFESDEPIAFVQANCVFLPWIEMSRTGVRTSVPPELMSMISSSSVTCKAPTVRPLRSVVCKPITPCPPRPWTGKSSTAVSLP
jgi:hypothetical protein